MEFASQVITAVVQSLMVPIKEQLGFIVSSTKLVKKMDAKVKQLNVTAQEVQDTWAAAVGNTEVVPQTVEPWLEDVKTLNERSNLIEPKGCFNVAKRYKVGKQSHDILEEIKDLENRKSSIVFTHVQRPLAEVGSTSAGPSTSAVPVPMGTQIDFESRDLIFNNALQALQSNNESQKMMALCGMGGVGKTTMMEQLKKTVKCKSFDLVVKVVIGENTNIISLQQAIAKYIGNDLTEPTKDARADRLREIFEVKSQQGKKVLVIMDDLWNEVDLNDVGLSPLPNGFKLFFTSRSEDVCTRMGVRDDSIIRIGFLRDTEAKKLFYTTVGPSPLDGDDVERQRIGEKIVMKCGGLPIAIVTIAKSLSGNITEAWQKALWRLEKDDLKDLNKIINRIFEMSYENLKEDDDRAIFLLSGIFPDDFDIRIEDLLRYGWGLNLFKDVKNLAIARRDMKISVNNLIRANLLIESEVNGCVKMHDLVRAFVLTNLSEVKQASIVNHENLSGVHTLTKEANKSYERILLKCTDICEVPRDFNYSNLSLLILMDGKKLKFPEDIYERMEKLKVMSYESLGIPLLPVMFEHSTKLRTLCLRSCLLIDGDISFLGRLCNLEILSLADCKIIRLPSTIGKLKKLKLLDLRGCINLHIEDGVIQNLDSLEELYMSACKGSPIVFTHANCEELAKLSGRLFALELEFFARNPLKDSASTQNKPQLKNMSFKNIERFKISIGCELEAQDFDKYYSFKNKLNLVADCNELQECNINELFQKTEELRLQVNDMSNLEDVSTHDTFSRLKVFHVSKCANLTCLFTTFVASGLKNLERLVISECPVLEVLVSDDNGVGAIPFQKLKFLSLEGLPNMVSLCNKDIELPQLVELRLRGLPNFTSIYPENNNNNIMSALMQPLLNREGMIPKLEILDISMMENLKQVWSCQISTSEKNNVSMLRKIYVRQCNSLTNLFPINPLPLLNHLEDLGVTECGSIEVLFNIDFECVSEMGEYNSMLRGIGVKDLGKLTELWRMRGVNNSTDTVINGFKGVQCIKIETCKKFTNIFTPTTANFDLGGLLDYITNDTGCDVEESYRKNKLPSERDQEMYMTYPSYLLHTFHHLERLTMDDDKRVEVVFDMDTPCSSQLATIQQPLLLPYLKFLYLSDLKEMSHVWRCNWIEFLILHHPPLQFPFQNLIEIVLSNCHKIKYLFSPIMAKYLSNLKTVRIWGCNGMEEVVSSRDDDRNEENTNSTLFPHLEHLKLDNLSCLKSIDSSKISSNLTNTIHGQSESGQVICASWSLCQYPKTITIASCPALEILIPWYAVGQMIRLEELIISGCKTLMEIFESESINNVDKGSAPGTTLTSQTHSNVTTLVVPRLSNLTSVNIYKCGILSHVFTFSTIESLKQLKLCIIKRCNTLQVIVKEEDGTSSKDVVFPCLESIELNDLPNLKGFFLGLNKFQWPLLENVSIRDCPQMIMFTHGQSKTPKLKYIRTNLGKYSLECGLNFRGTINQAQSTHRNHTLMLQKSCTTCSSSDPTISKGMPWSFHNLIEMEISNMNVGTTAIPSNVLLQLEKLEKIRIVFCHHVEEVFEVVVLEGNESQTAIKIPIPNLTQVKLIYVNLKYLWKSNQLMVLEFPNLTTVSIHSCNKLEHVFTCSMVGSLVQLQDLEIRYCANVEVIVKEEEEEEGCDSKVNEIIQLPRLKSLQLERLSTLKGFCLGNKAFSLPALDTLRIEHCPAITLFTKGDLSTPHLNVIDTNFGKYYVKPDLNSFIETKQGELRKLHICYLRSSMNFIKKDVLINFHPVYLQLNVSYSLH